MSTPLVPSFRRPNIIPTGAAHEAVASAIQSHDDSITDLNEAVYALHGRVEAVESPVGRSGANTSTEVVSNTTVIPGGAVNNQSGNAVYTTTQSDDAALIILSYATAIAVTLNFSVTTPWYASFSNQGVGDATLTPQQGEVNGAAALVIPGGSWTTIFFDGSDFWAESPGATAGGVTQIIAGTGGITISPTSGLGAVTINSTGGGGGYSLGGALSAGNISLGPGAGTGATGSISGLDGTHTVTINTGTSPATTPPGIQIYAVAFTAPRGHVSYAVISPTNENAAALSGVQQVIVTGGSATYSVGPGSTALAASTTYAWNISCP